MSIYMNYYVLSPQGRKKFEDWQQMGITTGPQYQVVEYLYKKNAATIAQIAQGTKLPPKEVASQIELFSQAGYLMTVEM